MNVVIFLLSLIALLASVRTVHLYHKSRSDRRMIDLLRGHCCEQQKKIKHLEVAKEAWKGRYARLLLFYGHTLQDISSNIHRSYPDCIQDSRLYGWLRGMAIMGPLPKDYLHSAK